LVSWDLISLIIIPSEVGFQQEENPQAGHGNFRLSTLPALLSLLSPGGKIHVRQERRKNYFSEINPMCVGFNRIIGSGKR